MQEIFLRTPSEVSNFVTGKTRHRKIAMIRFQEEKKKVLHAFRSIRERALEPVTIYSAYQVFLKNLDAAERKDWMEVEPGKLYILPDMVQ